MIQRPETSEYDPYYEKYIALVQGGHLTAVLDAQLHDSLAMLREIPESTSLHRYAPAKWSIRELLGHLIDTERIFTYRALRFARGDRTALTGFDQDPYVAAAGFDARPWSELIAEFEHVRRSTSLFFGGLRPEAALRTGTANNAAITVRALGYIIAGHELHHRGVLRDKYL